MSLWCSKSWRCCCSVAPGHEASCHIVRCPGVVAHCCVPLLHEVVGHGAEFHVHGRSVAYHCATLLLVRHEACGLWNSIDSLRNCRWHRRHADATKKARAEPGLPPSEGHRCRHAGYESRQQDSSHSHWGYGGGHWGCDSGCGTWDCCSRHGLCFGLQKRPAPQARQCASKLNLVKTLGLLLPGAPCALPSLLGPCALAAAARAMFFF